MWMGEEWPGAVRGSSWPPVAIAWAALLVVGPVLAASAARLDALGFGDAAAAALGIDVDRTRWVLMTLVALLTGAMVAVSGVRNAGTTLCTGIVPLNRPGMNPNRIAASLYSNSELSSR
jgi:ABC-type cobalamin transport system permease subunit